MIRLLSSLLLSGLACVASAQDAPDRDDRPARLAWGIGIAAAVSDSPYAGEGARVIPVPLLSYEGERFYFRGVTAGWRLVDTEGFELSVLGQVRFDGFDVEDLGRAQLARNGVDAGVLEDRDRCLDLGVG